MLTKTGNMKNIKMTTNNNTTGTKNEFYALSGNKFSGYFINYILNGRILSTKGTVSSVGKSAFKRKPVGIKMLEFVIMHNGVRVCGFASEKEAIVVSKKIANSIIVLSCH